MASSKAKATSSASTSTNESPDDTVRHLLRQVWRQHSTIVQGLKADLHDSAKIASRATCERCKDLESRNSILNKLLEKKEQVINNLNAQLRLMQKYDLEKLKIENQEPLVAETQVDYDNHAIHSENPYIPETVDPAGDFLDIEPEINFGDRAKTIYEPDFDATYLPEFAEDQADTHSTDDVPFDYAKAIKKEPADDLPANDVTFGRANEIKKEATDDSPSLLSNAIKKSHRRTKIGNISVRDKTKRAILSPGNSSGFLSSIKNSSNFGTEILKSRSDKGKRSTTDVSFSPSKRKSRKLHLKQMTLDCTVTSNSAKASEAGDADSTNDELDASSNSVTLFDDGVLCDSDFENEPSKTSPIEGYDPEADNSSKPADEHVYKFEKVTRKQDERRRLDGHNCHECEKYYKDLGLPDDEMKKRMKSCSRHRAKFSPPKSPKHFWDVDFPTTQVCRERGYMNKTQQMEFKTKRRRTKQK